MTADVTYPNDPTLTADDYLVLGLATCFIKDDGEVHQVQIAEPIPSAALQALVKGIPTSYGMAIATTIGTILPNGQVALPAEFPPTTQLCDDFEYRATAAARTFKSRPEAQVHIPLGTTKSDFEFSVERKRVLNSERIIKAEDNVKQHAYTHQVL